MLQSLLRRDEEEETIKIRVRKGHVAQTNKTIDLFPRGQNGGSE